MTERAPRGRVSEREFVVERAIRASPEKIYRTYTDPRVLPRWWAPPGGTLGVEQMDVRPGGKYRYVQRTAGGRELVFVGTYLEVEPPRHLVYTFEIEGQGNPVTTTVDLLPEGALTRLTLTNLCVSKEVRDTMVRYGAEAGAKAALQQLARTVEEPGATDP